MKIGKIIKGIAGFYYVYVAGSGIYECKAKGIFRKQNVKPLTGDNVTIDVIDEASKVGNIVDISPRDNELVRPAVANIDQAMVIFSLDRPKPNLNLLDRFLITMERERIPAIICFNKRDLATPEEMQEIRSIYELAGYQIYFISARQKEGIEDIASCLQGKTTTVAGPSGVGKSSLINLLSPKAQMETGSVSEKIGRGKHTTRHVEFIPISEGTYILDTPGFSSMSVEPMEASELGDMFPEFREYEAECRFSGCSHINEPDCGVKAALEQGKISQSRYQTYQVLYRELKEKKKY